MKTILPLFAAVRAPLRVALLAAVLLVSSCASTQLSATSLNLIKSVSTGIIFPVQIITDDPMIQKNGCSYKIENQDSGEEFEFSIQVDRPFEVVSVPEGTYRIVHVYCTPHLRWLLTRSWPKLHVYPRKISVYAPHLLTAGKEAQATKYRVAGKKVSMATMDSLMKKMASPMKDHLVSAYLGTLVPPEITDVELKNDDVILESNPTKKILNWHPKFQPCFDNEHPLNELYVGVLAISVVYEDGSASSVQVGPQPNTYSPEFKQCVVDAAKAYHPHNSAKVLASYYF
jgi:hypothetical protein